MATARMNDGIYKMTISIITLGGAGFFFNTLNSCGLKSNKQVKMMFVLLILVLYVFIDVWTADTYDIDDTTGTSIEGFYSSTGSEAGETDVKIVRNGIPFITRDTRHELNSVFSDNKLDAGSLFHAHADSIAAQTLHQRNFYHFVFSAAVSGIVIGLSTFITGNKVSNSNR